MTLPNPKFAPRRNDLPWLRRRRKPPAVVASAATAAAVKTAPPTTAAPARATTTRPNPTPARSGPAPAASGGSAGSGGSGGSCGSGGSGGKIDYTRRDRSHPAPSPTPAPRDRPASPPPAPPRRAPAPAAAGGNSLDLSAPSPTPASSGPSSGSSLDLSAPNRSPASSGPSSGSSLDLSSPTPAPASSPPRQAARAAPSGGDLLDLSGPTSAPPAPVPSGGSTSLDLGGGDGGARSGATPPPKPPPSAVERHHVVRRTRPGAATLLDFSAPVVTLDRLQSGIGQVTFDAVVGDEAGDLRIGAAWATFDGRTGTVELDAGRRHGPDNRRPVVWALKEGRFERIALDLRQSRSLARLLIYAFSPSKQSITWGGTVVVTTYGGDRIDAPIVSAPSPAVLALVSLYNVDGEFVLRSEMDPVAGSVRGTCRAFGYDRISWLDDRTPVA